MNGERPSDRRGRERLALKRTANARAEVAVRSCPKKRSGSKRHPCARRGRLCGSEGSGRCAASDAQQQRGRVGAAGRRRRFARLEDQDAAAKEADGGEEDVVVAGDFRADSADLRTRTAMPNRPPHFGTVSGSTGARWRSAADCEMCVG